MESLPIAELLVNDRTHRLTEGVHRIGRKEGNEIVIDHDSVSSYHASVTVQHDQTVLTDHGSTNGTFVNGQRIISAPLANGDRVAFGTTMSAFSLVPVAGSPPPLPPNSRPSGQTTSTLPPTLLTPRGPDAPSFWWPTSRWTSWLLIGVLAFTFLISFASAPAASLPITGVLYLTLIFFRKASTSLPFPDPDPSESPQQTQHRKGAWLGYCIASAVTALLLLSLRGCSP